MHSNLVFIMTLVSLVSASTVLAQSGSDRISRPRDNAPVQGATSPTGELTFTNRNGSTYNMADLTSRLQQLRTAVDQALPLLSAFNENFSNTASTQPGGLAGVISGIFSGRSSGNSQDHSGSSTRRSPALSNIVGALQGLLGTNAAGSRLAGPTVNTNTVHDLLALESELQPVASVLRNLNLNNGGTTPSSSTEQPSTPRNNGSQQLPTPTGRQ